MIEKANAIKTEKYTKQTQVLHMVSKLL